MAKPKKKRTPGMRRGGSVPAPTVRGNTMTMTDGKFRPDNRTSPRPPRRPVKG